MYVWFDFNNFNSFIESKMLPDARKLEKVVPVYKKYDKKDKSNYRPISIYLNT